MTDLSTPEKQRQFIEANWSKIAASAWQGYQQVGRGAILILARKQDTQSGSWQVLRFRYVPYQAGKQPFTSAKIDVTRGYNPREAIVVIVVTEETGPKSEGKTGTDYVVSTLYLETPAGAPRPPEAGNNLVRTGAID